MMTLAKIALRNIRRNGRRSLTTIAAVAVGAAALVCFGEFVASTIVGLETGTVRRSGHLSLFQRGYVDYGAGNPGAYGIGDYPAVLRLVAEDPVLKPMLAVATPTVTLTGIAENAESDASKTFLGIGVVPADRDRMLLWDAHDAFRGRPVQTSGLSDDEASGVVGVGLARVLGLCAPLKLADCPPPPPRDTALEERAADGDVTELAGRERAPGAAEARTGVRLELLAATAGGAPNVLSLYVDRTDPQGVKELDDNYVGLNFRLAQRLLFGRGEPKAVAIVLQLRRTEDLAAAKARLAALVQDRGLEMRDFAELNPFYRQAVGLFSAIFLFVAVIMGVIVLFTVVNTMSMTVVERTTEIGTARALGVRRSGIRRQFLVEGWLLGAIGATAGLVLAAIVAAALNGAGVAVTFPGQAAPVPLRLLTSGVATLQLGVWLALVLVATLAALVPANRAARMPVVDALRHV